MESFLRRYKLLSKEDIEDVLSMDDAIAIIRKLFINLAFLIKNSRFYTD
ncbi:MAG: hypothetical protein IPJ75_16015 [Ignavibacteriales bacterium]|nr:hypothetical protein [Ignavibacteriales bacterium]